MNRFDFDKNYRLIYMPLGMYALRIVGNAEDADDIVQNAFIKAWQQICSGKDIENFKSFMYRVVRNDCISFLRNQKPSADLDNIPEVDEEVVDTSERDARIWRAIDDLPEKCRRVFLLSKRDGLSNQEIAEEMGISVKTVTNQMTKAFRRLRDALSSGKGSYRADVFFLPFL